LEGLSQEIEEFEQIQKLKLSSDFKQNSSINDSPQLIEDSLSSSNNK